MNKGTIKSLISDKNFGFITPEAGSKDIFFHATSLVSGLEFSSLHIGDVVTFETEDTEKGPRAINVTRV